MTTIGIISVPEKKVAMRRRFLRRIVIKEKFGNNNKYIVAELFCTEEELKKMSSRRALRAVRSAKSFLVGEGAEKVLLSKTVRDIMSAKGIYETENVEKLYKIPPHRMVECFMIAIEKYKGACGGKMPNCAVICDRELKGIEYDKLSRICMEIRCINILTENTRRGEKLSEELFEEYGVMIGVFEYDKITEHGHVNILIDVDAGRIRINDFVIDGAEFISNSGNYQLDPAEEAVCLGDECDLVVQNLISGKNIV